MLYTLYKSNHPNIFITNYNQRTKSINNQRIKSLKHNKQKFIYATRVIFRTNGGDNVITGMLDHFQCIFYFLF